MARGAARACALVACAAGALATFGAASAQTHRSAAQADRDRQTQSARAQNLRTQEAAARHEIAALDARLVDSTQRRTAADAAATANTDHLTTLRVKMAEDDRRGARARDAFESALIAAAFAERRVEPRAVRAGIFARAAAPEFAQAQRHYAKSLADGRVLEASLSQQQVDLTDAQAAIDTERAQLVTQTAQRRATATTLASNAAAAERRARQYASEAQNLRELAARVQRRTPGTTSAPAVIPAAWVAPVEGRVIHGFGSHDAGAPASQGAVVRTRAGAQVTAPATGEVAYAGLFRSYGQVLILNLDGGYVLVLTGLENINARVGDTVRAGQTIGLMSSAATSAPELYVEVRRNGRPIDPGSWLNGRLSADRDVRAG